MIQARPFLRWVGGKRELVPELRKRLPETFGAYHEPFVGGAALFFALQPERAVLADANLRLVRTYQGVRDHVEEVIANLKIAAAAHQEYGAAYYYDVRQMPIDTWPTPALAAWFIYTNKVGFNGLYRVNKRGDLNTPIGKFKTPPVICDEENLRACSTVLQRAQILYGDFASTVEAHPGDIVYFDPPYVPLTATSNFTSYTADGFDHAAQTRLRDFAADLKARGVHVLLSNSAAPAVSALYSAFEVAAVDCRRSVNAQANGRGPIKEFVIR